MNHRREGGQLSPDYPIEIYCKESGWKVPILASKIISKDWKIVFDLIPNKKTKSYEFKIRKLEEYETLELFAECTYSKGEVSHSPDGINTYRTKISTLRGDYKNEKGNQNRLRLWEKSDFTPRVDDIFQERLYCIQWMKKKNKGSQYNYQFRSVTDEDIAREEKVIAYVGSNLSAWQDKGWIPDMVIEKGYNTDQPIRERGWTHWHHLFNPRQLIIACLINKYSNSTAKFSFSSSLNSNSRLSRWDRSQIGGGGSVKDVFYNQALNTLFDYGCRASTSALVFLSNGFNSYPLLYN